MTTGSAEPAAESTTQSTAGYAAVAAAAAEWGLLARGGFHPTPDDGVPPLPDGRAPASVILLGNAGPAFWHAAGPATAQAGGGNPLDAWIAHEVGALAQRFGATPLYPFGGPPWWPFQRWAQRAEPVAPSPIGLLVHPDFGLWHAYRGALLFAEALTLPPRSDCPSPCATCAARPCLTACPVGAFAVSGYDVAACVGHIESAAGADCMDGGCRARHACPVGVAYPAEQARFHMRAFRRSHSTG